VCVDRKIEGGREGGREGERKDTRTRIHRRTRTDTGAARDMARETERAKAERAKAQRNLLLKAETNVGEVRGFRHRWGPRSFVVVCRTQWLLVPQLLAPILMRRIQRESGVFNIEGVQGV
jgi:hypothetical protein